MKSIVSICLTLSLIPLIAFADENESKEPKSSSCLTIRERLQPYGPTYIVGQSTKDEDNDWALEVQYSFKYIFADDILDNNFDFFMSYSGEFDFYLSSRESGPVINRFSNPAAHFQWEEYPIPFIHKARIPYVDRYDVGLEHRSNGQVTDATEKNANGEYLTEINYQQGSYEYFDGVSRSANYLSFAFGGGLPEKLRYAFGLKLYVFDEESEITWGHLAGSASQFSDYDRVTFSCAYQLAQFSWDSINLQPPVLTVDYRMGDELLKTDSVDIGILLPLAFGDLHIPLFLKTHFGPMERLSDYSTPITSYSIGLSLLDFDKMLLKLVP